MTTATRALLDAQLSATGGSFGIMILPPDDALPYEAVGEVQTTFGVVGIIELGFKSPRTRSIFYHTDADHSIAKKGFRVDFVKEFLETAKLSTPRPSDSDASIGMVKLDSQVNVKAISEKNKNQKSPWTLETKKRSVVETADKIDVLKLFERTEQRYWRVPLPPLSAQAKSRYQ
ncbi:hypothetical protein LTR46_011320 [Exophiala xenobiotica]|nr:hypothetical protein LTR46_011320 [Exophiala xenobiotica]